MEQAMDRAATTQFGIPRPDEELLVREWRIAQLERLGLSRLTAWMFGDLVDWHEIAALVRRGSTPELAVEIVV